VSNDEDDEDDEGDESDENDEGRKPLMKRNYAQR
jgi:hypothetical protein